jgi:hypothetical protein
MQSFGAKAQMRASQFKTESYSRLFLTPKCPTAIPVASRLHRDMLMQLSLDSSVERMQYVSTLTVAGQAVGVDAIVAICDGVRRFVDIPEMRALLDVDAYGLWLMAVESLGAAPMPLCSVDIRSEPRLSNAREIWSHRAVHVSFRDRDAILAAVEGGGAATVREIERQISVRCEVLPAICSLACEGAVELDCLTWPLGESSMVRPGSAASLAAVRSRAAGSVGGL